MNLSLGDARQVRQIIDKPVQVFGLPVNRIDRLLPVGAY
jgi:hypothetical protein